MSDRCWVQIQIHPDDVHLIYENEGKMSEVGESGVPEKLRIYLDKKTKEAIVFGNETTKEFRAQVEQFQDNLIELLNIKEFSL